MFVEDIPAWFWRVVAFIFGAVWGSFFNVAIYRWPREMSVVTPKSHCPACGAAVNWYRNLPIVGYILLRGKSACCRTRLTPRYLVVEVISAVVALGLAELLVVHAAPETPLLHGALLTVTYFFFAGGLIIATFVDLEWMEIPDEVSLPGAAFGLASAPFRGHPDLHSVVMGAGGAYLAVQVLLVWGYERLTGRRGMGEGDSKLLMMIGAFIGWQGALFSVVAGSLQGLLAAVVLLLRGQPLAPTRPDAEANASDQTPASEAGVRHLKMPFGPFLALGALEYVFVGDVVMEYYFSWLAQLG